MSENINLYVDFGSVFTKVAAIDIDTEEVIGTAKAYTTLEGNILDGLNDAINKLYKTTGEIEIKEKFAVSSAMGGLKMITIGFVPQFTAEASEMAALGAGARVLKVYAYKLKEEDLEDISLMDIDVILICGGTDGGNKDNIIYNCEQIAKVNKDVSIVYAGNKDAAYDCRRILEATFEDIRITENVMPELGEVNIKPVRETIKEVYLERLIRAKGFIKVQRYISGVLMPTPSAIFNAASLLAKGTKSEPGIGELMVVDCGASTTDVYSIGEGQPKNEVIMLKGLPEPYEKRTVEGDLGLRYTAEYLCDAIYDLEGQLAQNNVECNINEHIKFLTSHPNFISIDDTYKKFDDILCKNAVKIAVDRHAGRIDTEYSKYGATFIQTGKDLTGINFVIGTGGAIVNSTKPKHVLEGAMFDKEEQNILKPQKAKKMFDKTGVMYALGMLGETEPDKAVRILKKYVK